MKQKLIKSIINNELIINTLLSLEKKENRISFEEYPFHAQQEIIEYHKEFLKVFINKIGLVDEKEKTF